MESSPPLASAPRDISLPRLLNGVLIILLTLISPTHSVVV